MSCKPMGAARRRATLGFELAGNETFCFARNYSPAPGACDVLAILASESL